MTISMFSMTLSLFLIMNSVGTLSSFMELIKELDRARQVRIIVREMLIALVIMVFFHYVGEFLLAALSVTHETVQIAGGVILFLIAIKMIFPGEAADQEHKVEGEPFVVPIATPMIAGPSVLTTIMLYAYDDTEGFFVLLAIVIAWILSVAVLLSSSYIKRLVTQKGLIAMERLMGLVLTMIGVEMFLSGIRIFIHASR